MENFSTPKQNNYLFDKFNLKSFTCESSNLKLNFKVHVHNETKISSQKCFIMTIHDLGFNHTQFENFINCNQMTGIRNRVIWLNVDLPGQEFEANDLEIKKFPSLEEIASELVCVLDHLKIPQVVCLGDGIGANISSYFAIKNPTRCLGVVLIEPIGSSASFIETIKYKLNHSIFLNRTKSNVNERSNFIYNRLGSTSSSEINMLNISMDDITSHTFEEHNSKNLDLFTEAVFNRPCLLTDLNKLKVDALIAVGKNSTLYDETKKIYKTLRDLNRKNPKKLVNSPYVEVDHVTNILNECPDSLATNLQFFLQGIGLLSAMPMSKSFKHMNMLSYVNVGSRSC